MPNNNYYQGIASDLSNQGRYGDSMLMHVNPAEVQGLASAFPGQVTINPETGLPEAFAIIPALLLGAAIGGITNVATGSQTPLWKSILLGAAGSVVTGGLGSALGGLGGGAATVTTEVVKEAVVAPVLSTALAETASTLGLSAAEIAAAKAAEQAALSSALSYIPQPPVLDPSIAAGIPSALQLPPLSSSIGQNLGAVGIGDGLGAGGIGQGVGINPAGQGISAGGIGDGIGSPGIFGDGIPGTHAKTVSPFEPGPYQPESIFDLEPLRNSALDTQNFAEIVEGLDPSYKSTIGDRFIGGDLGSNLNEFGQDMFGENYGFTQSNIKDYFTSLQPLGAFGFPLMFEEEEEIEDVPATTYPSFWTI